MRDNGAKRSWKMNWRERKKGESFTVILKCLSFLREFLSKEKNHGGPLQTLSSELKIMQHYSSPPHSHRSNYPFIILASSSVARHHAWSRIVQIECENREIFQNEFSTLQLFIRVERESARSQIQKIMAHGMR